MQRQSSLAGEAGPGKQAAERCSKAFVNDDEKRNILSHLVMLEDVPDRLDFVKSLRNALQGELALKDEQMQKADVIASIIKEAVPLCEKTFEIKVLVSTLKSKKPGLQSEVKLTEDVQIRSHPLLAALFRFEIDDSASYKWTTAGFNTWIKRNITAENWQEGYRRLLIEITDKLRDHRDELERKETLLKIQELGQKCDAENIPFLLLPSSYGIKNYLFRSALIRELPEIKDKDVLRAFGMLPAHNYDSYSMDMCIFCKHGYSLPEGRGFITLYKRGREWRAGGDSKESRVLPSLVSFLKKK